jgi:hypothetical protein
MNAAEVYLAYNRAENSHDWDATTALLAPDIHVTVNGVCEVSSAEDDRRAMAQLVALFPDYRREVLQVVADGNEAAIRWRMSAVSAEQPPVVLDVEGASFITVAAGQICEARLVAPSDELARALQLARVDRELA